MSAENLSLLAPTLHKLDMLGAFHRCDAFDGRPYVYLPALDPSAHDIPGGAKVSRRFDPLSVLHFDYDQERDGVCWICAYADALRTGRLIEASLELDSVPIDYRPVSLRDRLRELGILTVARSAVAEVAEARRAETEVHSVVLGPTVPVETRSEREVRVQSECEPVGNEVVDDIGYHRVVSTKVRRQGSLF